MDDFSDRLATLNAVTLDTNPQYIVDQLIVLESLLPAEEKKTLRSELSPEALLHKIAVYYAGRHQIFNAAREAEFCAEHDRVIFQLARFFITATRLRLISFELAAPLHSLLALPPLSGTIALLHFTHTLVFRLLADEEITASFGVELPVFLQKAASSFLEMVGLGVEFGLTANANLLELLLLKLLGHEEFSPLGCSIDDEFILNHQPVVLKSDLELKTLSNAINVFENAEQAMAKEWDQLKRSIDLIYEVLSIVYSACIHLHKNTSEISSDLLVVISRVAAYFEIKLLRFCIVPSGLRGFVRQWKRADEALKDFYRQMEQNGEYPNRKSDDAKKLEKQLENAAAKLPSLKFMEKYRESCVELAERLVQLQIRCFYFLNRQFPQLFGKLSAEFLIEINEAIYISEMAVDLVNSEQFKGYMCKYVEPRSLLNDAEIESGGDFELSAEDIMCIKEFSLYFVMPYYDFEGFNSVQVYEELLEAQKKCNESTATEILEEVCISNPETTISTTDVLFSLYGNYLSTSLSGTSNEFIKQNLESVENTIELQNFMESVNRCFRFIRKCCMAQTLRGYCILENFDNFQIYIAFISIFSIDAAVEKPFEILAQLISAMVAQFDNYNITLAVQLFISSIIARQISMEQQNIRDSLYEAGKIMLSPCLAGFRFNYNNIVQKHGVPTVEGDFGDLVNTEFTGLAFYAENAATYFQANGPVLENDIIMLQDAEQNVGWDIVTFDEQVITSGIIQTVSLLSQLMDDMYEKFTEELQGGFERIKHVSAYNTVLSNVMVALIQVVMPYFMHLDETIMQNMNFLLLELFQKLAIKSPLSSCPLILGLRHQQSLLLKVEEVLLGQTVEMVVEEQGNTEYITAFLFSCLLSKHTDNVYTELLNSKILYTSMRLFPFRIITRYLFHDNMVVEELDSSLRPFFDPLTKHFKHYEMYQAISSLDSETEVILIIGKLMSLLFESVAETHEEEKMLFESVVALIFGSKSGLLSFISPTEFCLNSVTNDTSEDSTMLLMMSLSQLCESPLNGNVMISFINYYLIYYSTKFKIDFAYAVGRHLDETLIAHNDVCKDLFHRWLSLSAIVNADPVLFSYCYTEICHTLQCQDDLQICEKKKDLLLHLSRNLHKFGGMVESNLLIQALSIESFELQICICRFLRSENYYLDRILINNIVIQNTRSFYEAFVDKSELLRELYDFDMELYEGLMPLAIEQVKSRVIFAEEYIKFASESEHVEPECPFSNLMETEIEMLNLHVQSMSFTDESIILGVKGGDKNSLWIRSLPEKYFEDVRDITSVTTEMAIEHTNLKPVQVEKLTLNQAAGLELLLGKELPKPNSLFEEAIDYLTLVQDDLSSCKCLRYASVPLRNHLAKYIEDQEFQNYTPITDLIPNIFLCHYVKMTNGFESYNQFQMDEIQKEHGIAAYSDNHFETNTSWIKEPKYYSLESIHTALQVIIVNSTSDNASIAVQTLVAILNNQILTLIQNSQGDLYKFINYTPLTSQITHELVLLALKAILERFAHQRKTSSSFCVLDDTFEQVSQALQNVMQQDDLIMELLNYNKTVVQYYYNKQLRRPKLNEEHLVHFQNCYSANEIAGKMTETGYCSSVSRLTLRHFTTVCSMPFILIVPFLLFSLEKYTPDHFKIMEDAGICEKLTLLLKNMRITKFTANIYCCFIENGLLGNQITHLLRSLIDECIDSPLFEVLLNRLAVSPESVVLLQELLSKTLNPRYEELINKYLTLNSGDMTELDFPEFMLRVQEFGQKEIDFLIANIPATSLTLLQFAERQFKLSDEMLAYVEAKVSLPKSETDVKILCYLAAAFGTAGFEDCFLKIPYFSEELQEEKSPSVSQNADNEIEGDQDEDGFVFADFEEQPTLEINCQITDATAELVAPLISGLPRFTIEFLSDLLQAIPSISDGHMASISMIVLAALGCFDFAEWYDAFIAGFLDLLNRVDNDYTVVAEMIEYIASRDSSLLERFGANAALMRIAGGQLEKPSGDEIHLKMGFL